jgi:predicted nuclease with RNAse H fold
MTTNACSGLFIGWDVGAWNCDKNPSSRDALVVLDSQRKLMGEPWRGSLRRVINQSVGTNDFLLRILSLCGVEDHDRSAPVVLAIDTPLGFSQGFVDLLVNGNAADSIDLSSENPYLFRRTERLLFERGLSPLSALKDMIGSQATKGMHVLARFAPQVEDCGVWTDSVRLRAIEAYPSACKRSATMAELHQEFGIRGQTGTELPEGFRHGDQLDALTCALIAWLFHFQPERLLQPELNVPMKEGWIFAPVDGLGGPT